MEKIKSIYNYYYEHLTYWDDAQGLMKVAKAVLLTIYDLCVNFKNKIL